MSAVRQVKFVGTALEHDQHVEFRGTVNVDIVGPAGDVRAHIENTIRQACTKAGIELITLHTGRTHRPKGAP